MNIRNMSCKDIEEKIFRYAELSDDEQKLIDNHCKHCVNCHELLDHAQHLSKTVDAWRQQVPEPAHHAQLTHKIMEAIDKSGNRSKTITSWIDYINRAWVRYSFASLSIALIFGFFIEPTTRSSSTEQHRVYSAAKSDLRLDTRQFVSSPITKKREEPKTFSLIACIENIDCPPLIEHKKKLYYENR